MLHEFFNSFINHIGLSHQTMNSSGMRILICYFTLLCLSSPLSNLSRALKMVSLHASFTSSFPISPKTSLAALPQFSLLPLPPALYLSFPASSLGFSIFIHSLNSQHWYLLNWPLFWVPDSQRRIVTRYFPLDISWISPISETKSSKSKLVHLRLPKHLPDDSIIPVISPAETG